MTMRRGTLTRITKKKLSMNREGVRTEKVEKFNNLKKNSIEQTDFGVLSMKLREFFTREFAEQGKFGYNVVIKKNRMKVQYPDGKKKTFLSQRRGIYCVEEKRFV